MNATVHKLERPGKPPAEPVTKPRFVTCGVCGVPHSTIDCGVLGRHLDWLRLRGLAVTTIYDRKRVLIRLGAALPVPVLDAAEGDLLAWRAGLTVSAKSIGTYVMHIQQLYRWAAAEGLIKASPAEHL